MNRKSPRVTPALCDAAKQYTRSRQRAQASGAADVLSPVEAAAMVVGEVGKVGAVVVQAQRRV